MLHGLFQDSVSSMFKTPPAILPTAIPANSNTDIKHLRRRVCQFQDKTGKRNKTASPSVLRNYLVSCNLHSHNAKHTAISPFQKLSLVYITVLRKSIVFIHFAHFVSSACLPPQYTPGQTAAEAQPPPSRYRVSASLCPRTYHNIPSDRL